MTPTEHYLAWFEKQPSEVFDHLGFIIAGIIPGRVLKEIEPRGDVEVFVRAVKRIILDNPLQDAGTALTLTALTDYAFMGRATKEDWVKAKEMNDWMQEHAARERKEDFGQLMRESRERFPFREAQWLKAATEWRSVRENQLSHDIINIWMRDAIAAKCR